MQNPDQLSLIELAEWYKAMLEAVKLLNKDIKEKLEGILTRGKLQVEEVLGSPSKLKNEIDHYVQGAQPFEWNRGNHGRLIRANIKKDWEQHEYLTIFAMILGDESFLKKWGVDYPLNAGGPGLANPSNEYIEVLEGAKEKCHSATHKQYYQYLIKELTPYLSRKQ